MPAVGVDSGQVATAVLDFQLLSCLLRAVKKTSDVSRTKFACVVASVVAQSRPVPLAACSSRSSMFLRTFSYPSSQARPFSLACAATWSLSSLTRFAAASSSALTSGIVMRGLLSFGSHDRLSYVSQIGMTVTRGAASVCLLPTSESRWRMAWVPDESEHSGGGTCSTMSSTTAAELECLDVGQRFASPRCALACDAAAPADAVGRTG